MSPAGNGNSWTPRVRSSCHTSTSRDGSLYGSGSISTALTTLKIATLAPMPRASVNTAVAAKPRFLTSERIARRTSCIVFMRFLDEKIGGPGGWAA